jgi:Transposase
LELLDKMGIECRVGDPARIRAAETRKQKHDRRDARLILDLLTMEDRFPAIWMPSTEQRDLQALLRDRHQWVKIRSRLQHTLQAIALNHALRQAWPLRGGPLARAVEHSPRTRTGSSAGFSLPNALVWRGLLGVSAGAAGRKFS